MYVFTQCHDLPRSGRYSKFTSRSQTVKCLEKIQQIQELNLILHKPHLACLMFKFKTAQLKKECTNMTFFGRVARRKNKTKHGSTA